MDDTSCSAIRHWRRREEGRLPKIRRPNTALPSPIPSPARSPILFYRLYSHSMLLSYHHRTLYGPLCSPTIQASRIPGQGHWTASRGPPNGLRGEEGGEEEGEKKERKEKRQTEMKGATFVLAIAHSTRHTVHGTRHTTHSTQYTVHSTQYTVHGIYVSSSPSLLSPGVLFGSSLACCTHPATTSRMWSFFNLKWEIGLITRKACELSVSYHFFCVSVRILSINKEPIHHLKPFT
jgi:hypothetical protein